MSALVSQPGSLGNPTPFFRVVDFRVWCGWIHGTRRGIPPAISEHSAPGLAYLACERYNAERSVINWDRKPKVAS